MCNNPTVTSETHERPPYAFASLLIITGLLGWFAAFSIARQAFVYAAPPTDEPDLCRVNEILRCFPVYFSPEGSVFGFHNELIGLAGWVAPVFVGTALLAGARFARWFWLTFAAGVTLAAGFTAWLIWQGVFAIATLCPWCLVTWAAMIPTFLAVVLYTVKEGHLPVGNRLRATAEAAFAWIPMMTLALYLLVAVVAQLRLDLLAVLSAPPISGS